MAAKKGFKSANPLDKMAGLTQVKISDPEPGKVGDLDKKKSSPAAGASKKAPSDKSKTKKDDSKRKRGRPVTKTEPTHTTNIEIYQELFDKFLLYKQAMGGSMTAYINRLIRKDLEENEDLYRKITDMMIK